MQAIPLYLCFCLLQAPVALAAVYVRPQYICLNRATPTASGWDPAKPASFTQSSVDEMLAAMNSTRGTDSRRLCLSLNLWTLYGANTSTALESLDALLALVEVNDVPISISIDPTQWWQTAAVLYNWDAPGQAGYDPANALNVEWSSPSPAGATNISWRNWGSQFRMPSPHPNFASPAFRSAAAASVFPLAARLAGWFAGLPPSRRYLLAYARPTQELWM